MSNHDFVFRFQVLSVCYIPEFAKQQTFARLCIYIQKKWKIYLQDLEEKNCSPVVTPLGSHKTNHYIRYKLCNLRRIENIWTTIIIKYFGVHKLGNII
jgi:hypothetical protein